MIYRLSEFGCKLREIRKSMGLRQIDVQKLVDINIETLRRIEGGHAKPRLETLDLLSIAYKRDLYSVLAYYRDTPMDYIERCITEIYPYTRELNYNQIYKMYQNMKNRFQHKDYSQYRKLYIKIDQFHEYIKSLSNLEKSFVDKSRNDLSILISILNLSREQIYPENPCIHMDILEIRICILISIIYRFHKEYYYSELCLLTALKQLDEKHKSNNKYLYFYILITTNLMEVYNRMERDKDVIKTYNTGLSVLDQYFGIANLAALFIRKGVSNFYISEELTSEYLEIAVSLFKDSGKLELAKIYDKRFSELYEFYKK